MPRLVYSLSILSVPAYHIKNLSNFYFIYCLIIIIYIFLSLTIKLNTENWFSIRSTMVIHNEKIKNKIKFLNYKTKNQL